MFVSLLPKQNYKKPKLTNRYISMYCLLLLQTHQLRFKWKQKFERLQLKYENVLKIKMFRLILCADYDISCPTIRFLIQKTYNKTKTLRNKPF